MDRLPEELLLQIFESIGPSPQHYSSPSGYDRTWQHAQICLVSTKFRRIATPLLYQSIECGQGLQNITDLGTTLMTNPKLGDYIKSIRIKSTRAEHHAKCLGWFVHPRLGTDALSGAECVLFSSWLERLCPEQPDWIDIMRYTSRDVILALCVLTARNLRSLWISGPRDQGNSPGLSYAFLIQSILDSAAGSSPSVVHSFEHLRTLHLDLQHCKHDQAVQIVSIMQLPHLEDLTLARWGDRYGHYLEMNRNSEDWSPRSSNVVRLSLLMPKVSSHIITGMIRACKALKRFEFTRPEFIPINDQSMYAHIFEAIHEHASSIEEMSVGDASYRLRMHYPHERLRGLQATQVRKLRIPYEILRRFDESSDSFTVLPPSIEIIILQLPTTVGCSTMARLRDLCDACQAGEFPNLKRIELRQERYHYADHGLELWAMFQWAKRRWKQMGVVLSLRVSWHPSKGRLSKAH